MQAAGCSPEPRKRGVSLAQRRTVRRSRSRRSCTLPEPRLLWATGTSLSPSYNNRKMPSQGGTADLCGTVEVCCLPRRPHHSAKTGMTRRIGLPPERALRGRLCTQSGRAGCLLRRRSSTRPSQTADVGLTSALHVQGDCERAGNRAAPSGMGACASRSSAPRSPSCAATPVRTLFSTKEHGTFLQTHQGMEFHILLLA